MKTIKRVIVILMYSIIIYFSSLMRPCKIGNIVKYKDRNEIAQKEVISNIKTKAENNKTITSRSGFLYQRQRNIIYKMIVEDKTILYFKNVKDAETYKDRLLNKNPELKIIVSEDMKTPDCTVSGENILENTLNDYAPKPKIEEIKPIVKTECFPTVSHKVSSNYGNRKSRGDFHSGIDLCGQYGDNIYAYKDGVVIKAQHSNKSYGNMILLKHKDGTKSRYAHLSNINVSEGQAVKCGEIIGKMGSTGNSTGNHLHFEIIINEKAVNPYNYIF